MEDETLKRISLSIKEAQTIVSVFVMAGTLHAKHPFLLEEELDLMEAMLIKLKREFFPEDYNRIVH